MLKAVSSITNAIGALNYIGTWDASTNTPTITSSVGTKGDYYQVSVAGATTINGISNWGVGDVIAFNGVVWQRIEGGADLNGVDLSVSGTTTLSGLTASTALALDANKNVVSVTNTGTGDNVLATSPTLVTPALGAATATSINKVALTAPATGSTLTIADGKTLTANHSLTLAGTDATTMTFPTTSATIARTDAGQTFTGIQEMTRPKFITSIDDTNGNELIGVTATASAVNEITVANAATGNNPVLSATGSDTNIGITLTPKGTGNTVLTSGNLVVANGKGIDFSATGQATGMTSELLADYEEGTWTPEFGGTNVNAVYTSQAGTYTKIGRTVFVSGEITVSSINNAATAGVEIRNLPFAAAANTFISTSFTKTFNSDPLGNNTFDTSTAGAPSNGAVIQIRRLNTAAASQVGNRYSDLFNASGQLAFAAVYQAA
jgi:hypothetical protein